MTFWDLQASSFGPSPNNVHDTKYHEPVWSQKGNRLRHIASRLTNGLPKLGLGHKLSNDTGPDKGPLEWPPLGNMMDTAPPPPPIATTPLPLHYCGTKWYLLHYIDWQADTSNVRGWPWLADGACMDGWMKHVSPVPAFHPIPPSVSIPFTNESTTFVVHFAIVLWRSNYECMWVGVISVHFVHVLSNFYWLYVYEEFFVVLVHLQKPDWKSDLAEFGYGYWKCMYVNFLVGLYVFFLFGMGCFVSTIYHCFIWFDMMWCML